MEQEVMQAIRAELESNIDAKYREFHSSLVPGTELSDSWCPHSGFATDCKSDSKRPL